MACLARLAYLAVRFFIPGALDEVEDCELMLGWGVLCRLPLPVDPGVTP